MKNTKSDEHTKTQSSFTNIKIHSLLHLLVVVEKREAAYEKWVDCFSWMEIIKTSCVCVCVCVCVCERESEHTQTFTNSSRFLL